MKTEYEVVSLSTKKRADDWRHWGNVPAISCQRAVERALHDHGAGSRLVSDSSRCVACENPPPSWLLIRSIVIEHDG